MSLTCKLNCHYSGLGDLNYFKFKLRAPLDTVDMFSNILFIPTNEVQQVCSQSMCVDVLCEDSSRCNSETPLKCSAVSVVQGCAIIHLAVWVLN